MLVRPASIAWSLAWSFAGVSGGGLLCACGSEAAPACATSVAPEVCETAGNLRGVPSVQETISLEPLPELQPAPLLDGRYAQTASTLYCPKGYPPPAEPSTSQEWVVEISGCVLRSSGIGPGLAEAQVSVVTLRYAADGTLDSRPVCPGDEAASLGRRYGFDGTTLQFLDGVERVGADGRVYGCELLATFELR